MLKKGLIVVATLTVLCSAGSAWALGLGIGWKIPTGDFGELYDGGYGANAAFLFPLAPTVTGWGEIGYTRFNNKLSSLGDIDVWGFNAGARVGLGALYLGGEIGYFTEIDDFGLTPVVGIGVAMLDFSARYKLTGDANWWDLRASISFGP